MKNFILHTLVYTLILFLLMGCISNIPKPIKELSISERKIPLKVDVVLQPDMEHLEYRTRYWYRGDIEGKIHHMEPYVEVGKSSVILFKETIPSLYEEVKFRSNISSRSNRDLTLFIYFHGFDSKHDFDGRRSLSMATAYAYVSYKLTVLFRDNEKQLNIISTNISDGASAEPLIALRSAFERAQANAFSELFNRLHTHPRVEQLLGDSVENVDAVVPIRAINSTITEAMGVGAATGAGIGAIVGGKTGATLGAILGGITGTLGGGSLAAKQLKHAREHELKKKRLEWWQELEEWFSQRNSFLRKQYQMLDKELNTAQKSLHNRNLSQLSQLRQVAYKEIFECKKYTRRLDKFISLNNENINPEKVIKQKILLEKNCNKLKNKNNEAGLFIEKFVSSELQRNK